ncbi:MAG TPA: hypothetical protein VGJ48_17795 [Pyrinomonadaceae bacterium]|jgi:hypothetical protein
MTYEKPEVLEIGRAQDVVQGLGKGSPIVDNDDKSPLTVVPEEVDE